MEIYFPPEASADFPVAMQVSDKYKVLYLITKLGFLHVFHLGTGTCLYMNRISSDTIFVTCEHNAVGGILGVNKSGQVLSVTIDEDNIVNYIVNNLANFDLAMQMASESNLPNADQLFIQQFTRYFQQGNYKDAALVAANSPKVCVLWPETRLVAEAFLAREFCVRHKRSSSSKLYLQCLDNHLLCCSTLVYCWRRGS